MHHAIFDAIGAKQMTTLQQLIAADPSCLDTDKIGLSPLMFAVQEGFQEAAEFIITHAYFQGRDEDKSNALHYAIMCKKPQLVEAFILKGAPISIKESAGYTPLHTAVLFKDLQSIQILLKHGASKDVFEKNNNGVTVLQSAIETHHDEVITLIGNSVNFPVADHLSSRRLSNIFNKEKLSTLLATDGFDYFSGGSIREALQSLLSLLQEYQDTPIHAFDLAPLKLITQNLKILYDQIQPDIYSISQHFTLPKVNQSRYFFAGFNTHVFYGSLINSNNRVYKFSLYERGFFSSVDPINEKKSRIKQSIKATNDIQAENVIKNYLESNSENENVATKKIWNDVPQFLNSTYKNNTNITQKMFTNGRCYYENLKCLILGELISYYGIANGRGIYKHLDLFLHARAINDFVKHSSRANKDEIISFCKEVLNKKIAKFNSTYLTSQVHSGQKQIKKYGNG